MSINDRWTPENGYKGFMMDCKLKTPTIKLHETCIANDTSRPARGAWIETNRTELTPEERIARREIVSRQTFEAARIWEAALASNRHTGTIQCVCRGRFPLWRMYHCYHCGLWLCEKCSKEHFGERPQVNNEYFKTNRNDLW